MIMRTIHITLLAAFVTALVSACAMGQTTAPTTSPSASGVDPTLPTLWIIGDSTVRNGTKGQMGWGDPIKAMFDASRINVVNRAIGGRSSRTFRTDGRWEKIMAEAKPGDFVIMQFGHNDPAKLAGDNRERGTIRGVGNETEEVTLTLKQGQKEVVHSYGWYMRTYVEEAKAKGMHAIVCSYVPRCPRPKADAPQTVVAPPSAEMTSYQLWAKQSADAAGATFIDLHSLILNKYAGLTAEEVKRKYFGEADFTHTNAEGAALNAACVVEGLRASDSPLKAFLLPASQD